MNWNEIIQSVFTLVLLPLLAVCTNYLVKFISVKADEIKSKNDNAIAQKYIEMARNTITECVIATNQTYVEAMKNRQAFDKEAQKEAFSRTLSAVLAILSEDAKEYLTNAFGDLNVYLTTQIEATVNSNKAIEKQQ